MRVSKDQVKLILNGQPLTKEQKAGYMLNQVVAKIEQSLLSFLMLKEDKDATSLVINLNEYTEELELFQVCVYPKILKKFVQELGYELELVEGEEFKKTVMSSVKPKEKIKTLKLTVKFS